MKVDFSEDAVFAEAVKAGIRDALLDPGFRADLIAHVAEAAANYVWLTREELARAVGGVDEKTVRRWARKHLITSTRKLGEKEELYSLVSVQQAMASGAIHAKKSAQTPRPARNGTAAGAAPLRKVSLSHN